MNSKILYIFCLVFLLIFSLIGVRFILAQDECPPCPPFSCPGRAWTEYRCTSNCNGEILTRSCSYSCWCSQTDACGCCTGCACSPTTCTDWTPEGTIGHSWQKCIDDGNAETKPYFACMGECLEAPKNPRYYDNPTYSDQPDKTKDANNIFLPVKLDWDEVSYWKASPDGPRSYRIRIENTSKGEYQKALDKSEYNYRDDPGAGSCLLKSNATHNWHVQACCGADGTNCGPTMDKNFKTNFAPEPISPTDPDWNGEAKVENISLPVVLDWCDVEDAKTYSFRVWLTQNGQEVCLPQLESYGECEPHPINMLTHPGKEGISAFEDTNLDFFTKDTFYKWAVISCRDSLNTDCSEDSQKWSFSTRETTLPSSEARYPLNDPNGEMPVGLPLTLVWQKTKGANSYIYEINPGEITNITTSTSAWFDYPTLNINSLYSWKIKPCWDYEGKKCEDFGETYYFKTTGAPPKNFSVDAFIIPVKLSWERVSGAGSYQYETAKDKNFLDIVASGSTEEVEITLNYPKVKQEIDYWWRIKTCAHRHGEICGNWSEVQSFRTFKLRAPGNLQPEGGSTLLTTKLHSFSWDALPGAKYYQYKIKYTKISPEERKEKCSSLLEQEITEIIPLTSLFHPLECKGEYQWQVQGCLDEKCDSESNGEWSPVLLFTLVAEEAPPEMKGGLIPCGQKHYNPDTPWDETESCQPKHLFILLYNILNFFLWKLIPIVLVLLVLATGVIFYFSLGAPTALIQIKSLWQAVGIGLGLIFLGWFLVDILLKILGYNVGVFGPWWKL